MTPLQLNRDPQNIARIFAQLVWTMVQCLIWATIGLASIAATYVAARTILVAVKLIFKALGI